MVSPEDDIYYEDRKIPAGVRLQIRTFVKITADLRQVAVSMSLRDILLDPQIFVEPREFRPQRWLPSNLDVERISKLWLPFGRGSRKCLGYKYVIFS